MRERRGNIFIGFIQFCIKYNVIPSKYLGFKKVSLTWLLSCLMLIFLMLQNRQCTAIMSSFDYNKVIQNVFIMFQCRFSVITFHVVLNVTYVIRTFYPHCINVLISKITKLLLNHYFNNVIYYNLNSFHANIWKVLITFHVIQ